MDAKHPTHALTPQVTRLARDALARRRAAWAGGAGVAIALLIGLATAGCASVPPPTERFAVARASIERAEHAGAATAAPTDIAAAEASPHTTDGAVAAGRLAEEAELDARVAEVTAETARSKNAALELDKSLEALRAEANRDRP